MVDEDVIPEESWDSTAPCPHCGTDMRPIVWGYPLMDEPLLEAHERGDVFLGGCVIPEGPIPQWHCPGCGRDVHIARAGTEA